MSKITFRIISGITTIIGGAGVAIVTALNVPNTAVINTIVVTVVGAIDELCTLFIKENTDEVKS